MSKLKVTLWSVATLGALTALGGALGYRGDIPYADVKAVYETGQSEWIDLQGSRIHYTDQGEGPTVVFIHGSGANLGAFATTATALATHGYRAISLDLPGSGLSLAGPQTGFHNTENVALVLAFLDALDITPRAIIGHSTGGQIAWTASLTQPDAFETLVLMAPTGVPTPSPLTWKIAQTPVLGTLLKNVTPAFIVRQNLEDAVFDTSTIDDQTVTRYHELLLREGARDALLARMNNVTFDRIDELACIPHPTLVLWGEEDAWLPAAQADTFANAIPDATQILLPNIGHNLPEEVESTTLATLLNDWLSQPVTPSPVAACLRAHTH